MKYKNQENKREKQKIKILILLTIMIISSLTALNVTQAMPEQEIQRVRNQVEQQINQQQPTFTEILTTVYFSPLITKNTPWCSPEKGTCFETTQQIRDYYSNNQNVLNCLNRRGGHCCILESHRGAYEEIKCQGSGVYEECQGTQCNNVVYHYSNIKTTQINSIPQSSEYTRGITRTQTDPQPKWTAAVNTKPGTHCYIPDGTLMYIFFEQGNPWNGIYRAEDTGSAFEGECKIDIYAGLGRETVNEAEKYISGKTPSVYVLEPSSLTAPHALSKTQLADEYKFISRQEYVARHGSQVIDTEYIPQINKELKQIGELLLPYSYKTSLTEIISFYDNIKEFSNEALKECENVPYDQKATCAYKIAKKYEDKIIINHCSNNTPTPISTMYLQIGQNITISGIILEKKEEVQNELNYLFLTLDQITGETITIKIEVNPRVFTISNSINDNNINYISLKNVTIKNINTENIEIEILTNDNQYELFLNDEFLNEEKTWAIQENMRTIALKTSDCKTTNDCLCKFNIIPTNTTYILDEYTIKSQGYKDVKTNIMLSKQSDADIPGPVQIPEQEELPEHLTPYDILGTYSTILPNAQEIKFIKGTQNSLTHITYNIDKQICEPQKRHVIFCTKPTTTEKSYFERTYAPKMNFTLKI